MPTLKNSNATFGVFLNTVRRIVVFFKGDTNPLCLYFVSNTEQYLFGCCFYVIMYSVLFYFYLWTEKKIRIRDNENLLGFSFLKSDIVS